MSIKITAKTIWRGNEVKIQGKKVVGKSTYETGLIVEGQAKELAARKYGYMAASVNTQSKDAGTELESPSKYGKETPPVGHDVNTFQKITKPNSDIDTLVGTHIDYSPYIEFGTVKMDAQPFLRPALDLAKGNVLNVVTENGKKYFGNYLRRPL
jgi:HK97 gp10 family phage protein